MENKSRYLSPERLEECELILSSYSFDFKQKDYCKTLILMRIDELKPLVNECIEKNVSLQELDNDINNEWNSLISLRNRFII